MKSARRSRDWLIGSALLAAFCSGRNSNSPAGPSRSGAAALEGQGIVGTSAAGDVKAGPIEINLVRVAQPGGVPAFYANAGGVYTVRPDRPVEIYIQIWRSDSTLTDAPRLIVEWGDGEKDNINCGPCALIRTYSTEGTYSVTVTMDDRAGGRTKRTFTLQVSEPPPNPTPTPGATPSPTPLPYCHSLPNWCPSKQQFCEAVPIDALNSTHAKDACEACYGTACVDSGGPSGGNGWVAYGVTMFVYVGQPPPPNGIPSFCTAQSYNWRYAPSDIMDLSNTCGAGSW